MHTRLGNTLYGAGLAGAAISIIFAIDAIWVHGSGKSLLPITGRFVSREDMLAAVGVDVALMLLSWGAGTVARYAVNNSAEKRAAAEKLPLKRVVHPVSGSHNPRT